MKPGGQTGPSSTPHSIPAPLGLHHADGRPVTFQDCQQQAARLRAINTERAGALNALERSAVPDLLAHAALCRAARWDILRLRAWGALEVLAREGWVL